MNQATRPPLARQNSKFVRMASQIDTERNEMKCEVGDATIHRPKQMKIFDWLSDYEFNDLSNLFIPALLFSILSTLLSGFQTDSFHSLGTGCLF